MTISNPAHWKEPFYSGKVGGPKFDKIVEMIAELNTPTVAPIAHKTSHEDGGSDEINGNLDLAGLKLGSAPASPVTDIDTSMPATPSHTQLLTAQAIAEWFPGNGLSSYVHKISALEAFKLSTINLNAFTGEFGVYSSTAGSQLGFYFFPPYWLAQWATLNSKTLTCEQIVVNWDNFVSADYITQIRVWWSDGNSASNVDKYNSTTDLGDGSTGFRTDTVDITDIALVDGEYLYMAIDLVQGTNYACRFKGFDVTWAIS